MSRWRQVLALLIVLAIFALRIDRRILLLPFLDREPISTALEQRADRLWPEFPRFIAGVRERTQNGDTIALVVPTLNWDKGYSYAYYRASYLLAGREVLPLAMDDGRLELLNFRRAKYIAAFGRFPPSHLTEVWSGEGGTLLRR